jgi:hypothetical protein
VTEIPGAWLEEAKATHFSPSTPAYAALPDAAWPVTVVAIPEVTPPARNPGVVGLHQDRTVSLLRAITSNQPLPAISVDRPPGQARYRLRDGYHRYYISVALGFSHVPVSERPYFELGAL